MVLRNLLKLIIKITISSLITDRPIMRTREVVNNNDDSNNTDLKDGQNDKLEKNRNFD